MDNQINKISTICLLAGLVVIAFDPRDPDAIISCDDEICKHDLKIATLDETLTLSNVTSLLVYPKHP